MPSGPIAILVWTYLVLAAGAMVTLTAVVPVRHDIAVPFAVAGVDPVLLGMAAWTGVCLATTARASARGDGAAVVFAVPSIVAAIALGGPTAAVWVGALGTTEVRELRGTMPWYAVLANHAMMVVPAAVGGTVTLLVQGQTSGGLGVAPGDLAAVAAGAAAFCVLNVLMAAAVVVARHGRTVREAVGMPVPSIVSMMVAESALGWVFAAAYVLVAWWSPVLLVLAESAASASVERGRIHGQLRRHELTALPNRLALDERVIDLRRRNRPGACVFYLDLDGFKAINDVHGYDAGDEVLRVTAHRLRAAVRDGDFLAHLHGDEFVILAAGVTTTTEADHIAERLAQAVNPPIAIASGWVSVGATLGFTLVSDLAAFDRALRHAGQMMQNVKDAHAREAGVVRRGHEPRLPGDR